MATLKTLLTFMLLGALVGLLGASWLGPRWIAWNNTATLATTTQCNLPEVVERVTSELLYYQSLGAAVGAGAFLVLGAVVVRRRAVAHRAQPAPAARPPAQDSK
jgi:hypothetical protein